MVWTTLIAPDALAEHLTDPRVVVVDCRYDLADPSWGAREYEKQHIPGAVFASIDDDLSGVKTGRNGRHPLPEIATLLDTFGRLGIRKDMQVIAYDQDAGMYASRLWWLLRWLGHDAVAVLDGGFAAWLAGHRPTRSGVERSQPQKFAGAPRSGWVADAGEVRAAIGRPDRLIVDARAPERFRGDIEPVDKVPGRIPGAVNYFYRWNIGEDGLFRPPSELRSRLLTSLGGVAPERVIGYCGSGVTACHILLACEHAGLHGPRLYPGSWSEWLSDPARPIERG
jgi:thiosulfate/3-mercaptopyruvate sulfurtransferase